MSNSAPFQFDDSGALLETQLPLPRRSGKVRDVYDLGDELLVVSTDRISAFDYILPCGIPDKGKLLTKMSEFWFDRLEVKHHLLSSEVPKILSDQFDTQPLEGRIMVVRKADVVPFECVARGYLEGSGWKEYQATREVCGNRLPDGLTQCAALPEAIFTPATKAEEGHDENVSIGRMIADVGSDLALQLRDQTLRLYKAAAGYAKSRGIIIADTKFEFGLVDGGEAILIDEVLTPDSSRFWDAATYEPGHSQPSFDKQFVREWLMASDWDRNSPPPILPAEIIEQTAAKYQEAFDRLAG
ncbi:phosphoribosylaminoimidazolesuccinocarboxamide synthase [Rhodopirellula sp. MGV]|uniref:phosphoribosylaminoimidazolesuccinocarboxamide synthase n=1 Tax=Rhodopirellula sp. MGV TaxID=2023130 RepID=UPI000B967308|nr:phosphoribosylaminoimidazolesuccinocarboxamide synthase [Rhodopirellula sp. MGV]OYP38933.1 phosphoribosylaminoimidazolesuccinocarboxamide synthase [Rhodopirellula sp. MGV]PNY37610.1 phosphoribosylaminoimidazolesuccinocarboxamide synthase [Rhodopirellula baltica]